MKRALAWYFLLIGCFHFLPVCIIAWLWGTDVAKQVIEATTLLPWAFALVAVVKGLRL